jgi:hypothetical protein
MTRFLQSIGATRDPRALSLQDHIDRIIDGGFVCAIDSEPGLVKGKVLDQFLRSVSAG